MSFVHCVRIELFHRATALDRLERLPNEYGLCCDWPRRHRQIVFFSFVLRVGLFIFAPHIIFWISDIFCCSVIAGLIRCVAIWHIKEVSKEGVLLMYVYSFEWVFFFIKGGFVFHYKFIIYKSVKLSSRKSYFRLQLNRMGYLFMQI